MPRDKRLLLRAAGLLGLVSLAWLGDRAGHSLARAGWFHQTSVSAKTTRIESSPAESQRTTQATAGQAASALKRLRAIVAASPYLGTDWDAQAEINSILAKLSADELAAIYEELDSGSVILARKVGLAWVAKDPSAALSAMLAKRSRYHSFNAVVIFGEWAANDPSAALAWLDSTDLPPELAEMKARFRRRALPGLLERDFDLATSELSKFERGAEDSRGLLEQWASVYAGDPAMRERLVKFAKSTGRPDDYAQLNSSLLRSWPQEDSQAMLEYLKGLRDYLNSDAVPVEARPKVDATAVGAAIHREYTGPALEWWMERYSQSSETPKPLRESVSAWVQKYPDQARQWFDEQPASPQRDSLSAAVVTAYAARGKFQEADGMLQRISDPKIRQSALERLDFAWTQRDPQAAAAWRVGRGWKL